MFRIHPRRRGFTLLELLVVVVIIAVLVAVLFPVFARRREPGGPSCRSHLRQLCQALDFYQEDYDHYLPPHSHAAGERSVTLPSTLEPYLRNPGVWTCGTVTGGDRVYGYDGSPDDTTVSFGYNWIALSPGGKGVKLDRVAQPADTVAFVESVSYRATPPGLIPAFGGTAPAYRHPWGLNIAWLDGHVKAERPGKLEETVDAEGGKPARDGIDRYRYWNLR